MICDADGNVVVEGVDWSWAELEKARNSVVFEDSDAIFDLHDKKIEGEPKKLHDFNDMKYERVQAPY